jgi:hypothetical protein
MFPVDAKSDCSRSEVDPTSARTLASNASGSTRGVDRALRPAPARAPPQLLWHLHHGHPLKVLKSIVLDIVGLIVFDRL